MNMKHSYVNDHIKISESFASLEKSKQANNMGARQIFHQD